MSWYEEWFDSRLYETLYAHRDEEEAQKLATLISAHVPAGRFPHLLDLGCGRGRHSHNFAEKGYRVTGTDLSPSAIEKARTIADERGLTGVRFEVRDMREPLPETFDAVLNLFTTFGYFLDDDENIRVLQAVAQMLRSEGRFVIDFLNAERVGRTLVPSEKGSVGELHYTIRRHIAEGMVHKEISFFANGSQEPKTYTERVKLYDKPWFEQQLQAHGFAILDVWG
ncbi:MAG: class I SAM-dependent DNA methyltransferase, partial [Balneolaceae bacterium]